MNTSNPIFSDSLPAATATYQDSASAAVSHFPWPPRVNPLISAAQPLLLAAGLLSRAVAPDSPHQLQQTLFELMEQFDQSIADSQPDMLDSARYALCALLDETLVSSSWGGAVWPEHSLLGKYYEQDFAGEEFFPRLEKAGKQRDGNTWLLEFYHLCLSLGYSGRFHRRRQTDASIHQLRTQLGALILKLRERPSQPLSPPTSTLPTRKLANIPLWLIAAVMAAVTVGVYQGLSWYLARSSDPLLQAIQAIGR